MAGADGHDSGTSTFRRDVGLERRLAGAIEGEVRFDPATRGRFATDASIYQIMPAGVVFPRSIADVSRRACRSRARHGVAGHRRAAAAPRRTASRSARASSSTSRATSTASPPTTTTAGTVRVEPGVVLERLNTRVRDAGWFFPSSRRPRRAARSAA